MMLGDFDAHECLAAANPRLAGWYYTSYMLLVSVVFVNMVIAMLTNFEVINGSATVDCAVAVAADWPAVWIALLFGRSSAASYADTECAASYAKIVRVASYAKIDRVASHADIDVLLAVLILNVLLAVLMLAW